ncbi:MAG: hypothetical protein NVSMB5_27360 [Candidatus Velthaea sp.]
MIVMVACVLLAAADLPVSTIRNDTVQLDAAERRVEAGPYETSLQVGLDGPVIVRVGVSLQASRITAVLRNVRGTARFHGDLSRLDSIRSRHINAYRAVRAKEIQ